MPLKGKVCQLVLTWDETMKPLARSQLSTQWGQSYKTFYGRNFRIFV
jgi:hypothetical protein